MIAVTFSVTAIILLVWLLLSSSLFYILPLLMQLFFSNWFCFVAVFFQYSLWITQSKAKRSLDFDLTRNVCIYWLWNVTECRIYYAGELCVYLQLHLSKHRLKYTREALRPLQGYLKPFCTLAYEVPIRNDVSKFCLFEWSRKWKGDFTSLQIQQEFNLFSCINLFLLLNVYSGKSWMLPYSPLVRSGFIFVLVPPFF